jgi:dipeptidyl-peptidase 4
VPVWEPDGDRFLYERELPGGRTTWVAVDPAAAKAVPGSAPPAAGPEPGVLRSLDGTHVLTVEAGNLVLDGRPLTSDAEPPELAYATTPDTGTTPIQTRRSDVPPTPVGRWSPDGRRLLTYRVDQRAVRQLELIESAPVTRHRARAYGAIGCHSRATRRSA